MNTIKISTIAGTILTGAIMCTALIVNSKEAVAFASNPIVEPTAIFSSEPDEKFQNWFNAKLTLEKYKNPLNYDYQVTPVEKASLVQKFQDDNVYQKEMKKLRDKIQAINYFRQ